MFAIKSFFKNLMKSLIFPKSSENINNIFFANIYFDIFLTHFVIRYLHHDGFRSAFRVQKELLCLHRQWKRRNQDSRK